MNRSYRHLPILIALTAQAVVVPLSPGQAAPATSPTRVGSPNVPSFQDPGTELLRKIEVCQSGIQVFSGRFLMRRTSPIFVDDVYTTGQFVMRRDPFAAYYRARSGGAKTREVLSEVWVDRSETYTAVRDAKQVMVDTSTTPNDRLRRLNFLLFGFMADSIHVPSMFEVEKTDTAEGLHRLKLVPLNPPDLGGVTLLVVDFDPETLYPVHVFFKEGADSETRLTIKNVEAHRFGHDEKEKALDRPSSWGGWLVFRRR